VTIHLVDAMAYIFRAFYSQPPLKTPAGVPVNATFGFLDFLLRRLRDDDPSHMAVVFDAGRITFRNEIYPDYKANRGEAPPEIVPQFEQCEQVARALGMPVFKVPGYEADDVLATLSELGRVDDRKVVIFSGDKDLAQLVDLRVTVHDPSRRKRFTVKTVPTKFGVRPDQMVDFLALTGDSTDNVPGVPGVGPKTASALLEALETLDGVYEKLDLIPGLPIRGAAKLPARLETNRHLAYLSRELVTLKRDLPLAVTPGDLLYRGASRESCPTLLTELGLDSMLPFVVKWEDRSTTETGGSHG
jgi:DNA polymerase I